MSSKNETYPPNPGKNARLAADACARGDWERAVKRVHLAAADRELMHPNLWPAWVRAPDDLFVKAMAYLLKDEMVRLQASRWLGQGVVCLFAPVSVAKLQTLANMGIKIGGSPTAWLGEADLNVEPAMWCAAEGAVRGLLHLMKAGAPAPEPLSAADAAQLPRHIGKNMRSALHLLAGLSGSAKHGVNHGSLNEIVEWLALGASKNMRISDGRDALGVAIDNANAWMVKALLEAGADPRRQDGKGRNAMALFERRVTACKVAGSLAEVDALKSIQSHLLAVMERSELAQLPVQPVKSSARSRAL